MAKIKTLKFVSISELHLDADAIENLSASSRFTFGDCEYSLVKLSDLSEFFNREGDTVSVDRIADFTLRYGSKVLVSL